ncbi:MAG: SGNH/GDSL hydrolase family protein [Planctomycetota bacterium]
MKVSCLNAMRFRAVISLAAGLLIFGSQSVLAQAQDVAFPLKAKRILFLGDSNTHAGGYVNRIDLQLRLQNVEPLPEIINAGLASETCTGLSEPHHPFPRPDVHERLDRALEKVRPDVVVACYGMNDGIYYPFSEERFLKYQAGINGLIEKVHAANAKLILITPPPFDPTPLKGTDKLLPAGRDQYAYFAIYEDYDDVMTRYAQWIMSQKDRVESVIDAHTALLDFATEKRKTDTKYALAGDGVHFNAEGHMILSEVILRAWGVSPKENVPDELERLAAQRGTVLHDAWLSHIGHKRPGTPAGLPLEDARLNAVRLEEQMTSMIAAGR